MTPVGRIGEIPALFGQTLGAGVKFVMDNIFLVAVAFVSGAMLVWRWCGAAARRR